MKSVILIIIASYLKPLPCRLLSSKEALLLVTCQNLENDDLLPPVPQKCEGNTDMLYKNCCVFPPFFTREVAKECGAAMALLFVDKKNNVTGFRRMAYDCEHWMCVLHRYGLLTKYGDLDLDKYYAHLDLWVGLNPMFGDAMLGAKVNCKEAYRFDLPIKVCKFYDIHGCIRNYINVDCPVPIPSKICLEKKAFFKECKEYYYRK